MHFFRKAFRAMAPVVFILAALILLCPQSAQGAPKKKFVVVIDAGHGGNDYGAIENEVNEKDVNLAVALRLGNLIKKKLKDTEVVYTRDNDRFVTLQGRADIANKAKADLFISIHCNSVDRTNKNRSNVQGATTYILGHHKDNDNLAVAKRENSVVELDADDKEHYASFDSSSDESYIIFEMNQKQNFKNSARFAMDVQNAMQNIGRMSRGVQQAGFWVLWSTAMPSALIELDFICNPEQAKFLASDNGQEKLAGAIFEAVKKYENYFRQNLGTASKEALPESQSSLPSAPEYAEVPDNPDNPDTSDNSDNSMLAETDTRKSGRSHKASPSYSESSEKVKTEVGGRRSRRNRVKESPVEEASIPFVEEVSTPTEIAVVEEVAVESPSLPDERLSDASYADNDISSRQNFNRPSTKVSRKASKKEKNDTREMASSEKKKAEKKKVDNKKADNKNDGKKGRAGKNDDKKADSKETDNRKTENLYASSNNSNEVETDSDENIAGEKIETRKETKRRSHKQRVSKVYKILLFTSDFELKPNDKAFKNLQNITSFREHNIYNYTYGESSDRQVIESLLEEIQEDFPEACVIERFS